jgi:hypothetical protein
MPPKPTVLSVDAFLDLAQRLKTQTVAESLRPSSIDLHPQQMADLLASFNADADPIGLDEYTDDVMLAELLARAQDRASRTPAPAGALLALVATLQGANDLLRICQEDSHANR